MRGTPDPVMSPTTATGTTVPTTATGTTVPTTATGTTVPGALRPGADPLRAIGERPWNYGFYAALRRVEAHWRDKPRLGTARRPVDEPVRLGQAPDLSFAPSSLHAVRPADAYGPPRIEVRFFGLFGPNGPLPLHLTEHARERLLHHADDTFSRFADLFHHRLLLLFYRAWAQGQPTTSLDRPGDDRFGAFVGSLAGVGTAAYRGRDDAPHHAKLHFAGLLARQVRNADGLASLLSGYLRRRVVVEPYVGTWLALPDSERTGIGRAGVLGGGAAALGRNTVLGRTVWDRQHHFRLHVGPLDGPAFDSLLPGGSALPAVVALVEQYVGLELGWDLRLRLQAAAVQPTRPGRHGRLGWTSWLGQADRRQDAELTLVPGPAMRRALGERTRRLPTHH
jgi:type VI secretion system protein ImpH